MRCKIYNGNSIHFIFRENTLLMSYIYAHSTEGTHTQHTLHYAEFELFEL